VSYPDHPDSLLLFDVEVEGNGSEWATTIYVSGAYDGPTDVIASKDYRSRWTVDDRKLLESGSVELELSSGEHLRQRWSSIITPVTGADKPPAVFERFPSEGELVDVSISPFDVDTSAMRYEWEGTVRKAGEKASA
jgi:hypothetical protein